MVSIVGFYPIRASSNLVALTENKPIGHSLSTCINVGARACLEHVPTLLRETALESRHLLIFLIKRHVMQAD